MSSARFSSTCAWTSAGISSDSRISVLSSDPTPAFVQLNPPLDTLVVDGLHSDDVHDTPQGVLRSDGNLDGRGVEPKLVSQLVNNSEWVGPSTGCKRQL